MENICYKTNPIKEAIARIDFLSPITIIDEGVPKQITDTLKTDFPIAESKEIIGTQFQISKLEVQHNQVKSTEWNFFDKERTKRACISQSYFFIDLNKYSTYEKFNADFVLIWESLSQHFPDIQIKRFGLRYINHISISKGNLFNWSKYLNRNLLSIFNVPKEKSFISRALHNLEFNYGDYYLRFQYGMHNPDYPAQIKKKIFILDMDAHYNGIMTNSDILDYFPKFHSAIQELFENSITNKFREMLDGE